MQPCSYVHVHVRVLGHPPMLQHMYGRMPLCVRQPRPSLHEAQWLGSPVGIYSTNKIRALVATDQPQHCCTEPNEDPHILSVCCWGIPSHTTQNRPNTH